MKPEYGLSNGFTAMIELDTGVYQMAEWGWKEFQIFDYGPKQAATIDQALLPHIENAMARSRGEGQEYEYLGRQSRLNGQTLDGCLVFGCPGEYRRIGEAGA